MRVTATVTKAGIVVHQDGIEADRKDMDLKVNWKGYHGVDTDTAEWELEQAGLGVRTWIWNARKRHYVTLLVRL